MKDSADRGYHAILTVDLPKESHLSRREDVIGKIAEAYDIEREDATKLLAFHRAFRAQMNDHFSASALKDSFENKRQGIVKLAKTIDEVVDATPFVSDLVRPFTFLTSKVADGISEHKVKKIYEIFDSLNPTHDSVLSSDIAKEMASLACEANLRNIIALDSEKDVKNFAKIAFANTIETMLSQKEKIHEMSQEVDEGKRDFGEVTKYIASGSRVGPKSDVRPAEYSRPFPEVDRHASLAAAAA